MEGLIGLAGVLVGALIAFLADAYRARREARMAGRLLHGELIDNRDFLKRVSDLDGDVPLYSAPRRAVWDGLGATFLRIASEALTTEIVRAYHSVEDTWITVRYIKMSRDDWKSQLDRLTEEGQERKLGARGAERLRLAVDAMQAEEENLKSIGRRVRERDLPAIESALDLLRERVYGSERRTRGRSSTGLAGSSAAGDARSGD